jgi:guanosine-3',5'-bis(diphosphate) 3'-pyrophosphohydrolase
MDIVERAKEYATLKHTGQIRKLSKSPYIVHPADVAELASAATDDVELTAAAWLHDVVEDTNTSLEEIRNEFGNTIASLVDEVTKNAEEQGNRSKKEYYHEKVRKITSKALTLKLFDRLANIMSVVADLKRDSKSNEVIDFAKYYKKQTQYIFEDLDQDRELTDVQNTTLELILLYLRQLP